MKVSIIIPVYNEAEILETIIEELHREIIATGKRGVDFEFIVVEDGSTDGTKELLKKLKSKYRLKLFMGEARRGYHGALKHAFSIPRNNVIFFTDSDGQHDPSNFWNLYRHIGDYDIVSGFRVRRLDPFHRIVLSRLYNTALFFLFGAFFRDSNCGFKLVKKHVIDDILGDVRYIKFGFSTEFLVLARKRGYRVLEVPVAHRERKTGRATQFELTRLPKAIAVQALGLLRLRRFLVGSRKYSN